MQKNPHTTPFKFPLRTFAAQLYRCNASACEPKGMRFFRRSSAGAGGTSVKQTPTHQSGLTAVPAAAPQFSNRAPDGSWHSYSTAQCTAIAAAMEKQRAGGAIQLVGTNFVVYWGTAAVSPRMATPPSGMLQVNATNGNTRVVSSTPAAVTAPSMAPSQTQLPTTTCGYSHCAADGTWEAYPPEIASQISAAKAAYPDGGRLTLPGGGFQVRWGIEATSTRMPKTPDTTMIQVNLNTKATRVVQQDHSTQHTLPAAQPGLRAAAPLPAAPLPMRRSMYPDPTPFDGGAAANLVISIPASDLQILPPSIAPVPAASHPPTAPPPSALHTLHEVCAPNGGVLTLAAGSALDYVGDALVNAANEGCIGGAGIDEHVNRSGGPRLRLARQALNGCPTGGAKTTPSFEHLRTRWIVQCAAAKEGIERMSSDP